MTQTSIVQPRLLSRLNERLVLNAIQAKGPSTRAKLTEEIGVTFATVAKAVSSLLEARLLEEYDEPAVGRGRPAKRLRLAVEESQVIGVAIEADETLITAAGLDGTPRETLRRLPTAPTYAKLISSIRDAVATLSSATHPKTLGVGISVAAQIDENGRRIAVSANLPYLSGKSLPSDLTDAIGVPCSMVRDTHALCLSERLRGSAKNLDNFLVLHLGVGIGVGVMSDGQIFFGQYGYAGELGHTTVFPEGELCNCGRRGCLETISSECAITDRLSRLLRRRVTVDDVARLYIAGDPTARDEVHRACKGLALGLSHAVHLFNPGKVVVYSRLFEACPELLLILIHQIEETALPLSYRGCEIVNASTTPLDGSIAHVIGHLVDSLAPRLSREQRQQAS